MDIDTDAGDTGFDLNSSIDAVAGGLGLNAHSSGSLPSPGSTPQAEAPALDDDAPQDGAAADGTADTHPAATPPATDSTDAAPSAPRQPPKSWARDKHELWSRLPADAQDYYETREKQFLDGLDQYKSEASFGKSLRDVMAPYRPMLAAQGLDEPTAVQYLLNANYRLTNGTREQRLAAYQKLGQDLQLADAPAHADLPPEVRQLQERLAGIESSLTARQQAEFSEARNRATQEVTSFASDPANLYFDEVADDIVAMIQAGHSLKDAYEKAVWANPVTRQKEIARLQTESEAKLREKAKQEAEAARHASSANIRGRESRRAPTEPKGTMEDTMRDTLEKIRNRAH